MKPRTTMPRSGKLVTAYKDGKEFREYCLRYGTIESFHDWNDIDGKPMRRYAVIIDGLRAIITMKTGEVIRFGYGLISGEDAD